MQGVIPPPSNAAIKADHYSDALQPVLNALKSLPARPSLGAASSLLLENGFRCMAATNGGLESTRGLFKNALGDQVAQRWEYYSCDEDRVAKPAPSVYAAIRKRLEVGRDDESWFVASHTWSVEDSFRMFIGPGLDQGTDNCVSPSIGISLLPKKQGELRLPRGATQQAAATSHRPSRFTPAALLTSCARMQVQDRLCHLRRVLCPLRRFRPARYCRCGSRRSCPTDHRAERQSVGYRRTRDRICICTYMPRQRTSVLRRRTARVASLSANQP